MDAPPRAALNLAIYAPNFMEILLVYVHLYKQRLNHTMTVIQILLREMQNLPFGMQRYTQEIVMFSPFL